MIRQIAKTIFRALASLVRLSPALVSLAKKLCATSPQLERLLRRLTGSISASALPQMSDLSDAELRVFIDLQSKFRAKALSQK